MGIDLYSIYDVKPESREWWNIKEDIENFICRRKEYHRLVLSYDEANKFYGNTVLGKLNKSKFIPKEEDPLFSNDKSFGKDYMIHTIPRYKLEYDQRYVHLIVACIIHDEYGNYLLLKPKNTSFRHTFVKGHVDVHENMDNMSQLDFLKFNMERELREEITIPKNLKIDPEYIGSIFYGRNKRMREHIGILFELELPLKELKKIRSNEYDKHNIVLSSLKNVKDGRYNLDDWSDYIFRNVF